MKAKKRLIKAINEFEEDKLIDVLEKFIENSKKPMLSKEQKELMKKNMTAFVNKSASNTGMAICQRMVKSKLENFNKLNKSDIEWLISCGNLERK